MPGHIYNDLKKKKLSPSFIRFSDHREFLSDLQVPFKNLISDKIKP